MVTNKLITYLSSTLCGAGTGEVPDQLTHVITAFVKERHIRGKLF